jgi:D-3-phosphoglycerate dehydrogenase
MSFKVVMTEEIMPPKQTQEVELDHKKMGVDFQTIQCNTEDEIIAAARDADAVITLMQPYSRRVIENLQKCRLIFNAGTGFDSIDLKSATEFGICVTYPGDYCTEEVSEHAMALLLACARKIMQVHRAVKEGKWDSFKKVAIRGEILPPMFRLEGQTLGIIGLGRTGRATVPKAKGFGMKVVAFNPNMPTDVFKEIGIEAVSFDNLLKMSDFVLIQAAMRPGVKHMKHMIGMEQLKLMKPTAYLINTARGSFIDQEALYTALVEGIIAGAGLDVMEEEPGGISADHPLLTLDNVIITAHTSYYSEQSWAMYKQRMCEAVASIMEGRWPDWLINPEVKDNFQRRWK